MNQRNVILIVSGMIIFILLHLFLDTIGFFHDSHRAITAILGGFSPSIVHDSLSTRNPAVEEIWYILADLPGAYSFYFSQIMVSPPKITLLTGEIAQWANFNSYKGRINPNYSSILGSLVLMFLTTIYMFFRLEYRHHKH